MTASLSCCRPSVTRRIAASRFARFVASCSVRQALASSATFGATADTHFSSNFSCDSDVMQGGVKPARAREAGKHGARPRTALQAQVQTKHGKTDAGAKTARRLVWSATGAMLLGDQKP
jgi:hypothetical protein